MDPPQRRGIRSTRARCRRPTRGGFDRPPSAAPPRAPGWLNGRDSLTDSSDSSGSCSSSGGRTRSTRSSGRTSSWTRARTWARRPEPAARSDSIWGTVARQVRQTTSPSGRSRPPQARATTGPRSSCCMSGGTPGHSGRPLTASISAAKARSRSSWTVGPAGSLLVSTEA